jgi:hypothetical protein
MASDGDFVHMYCVFNGRNRYSTAVLIAKTVRKYFVLEVRKGKIMTFRFIIENI